MTPQVTIPRHESSLYITDNTEPADVVDFAAQRLQQPAVLGDVIVYNFHGQPFDGTDLANSTQDLDGGIYVIPYQVSGVWTFMAALLPTEVAEATLMGYRPSSGEYHTYDNWMAQADAHSDQAADRLQEAFRSAVTGDQE